MDLKKPDRATLKSYFVKNAVPTERSFADLVDGVLNQRDDGIAKLPGEPLSLQAEGSEPTGPKKTLNFYKSFADGKPAWTLSLNPRAVPADAASARPGWSLGDADGNSKLFVDEASGNVGVGTAAPAATLHLRRDVPQALGPVLRLANGAGGAGAGGAIDFNGYDTKDQPATARIGSLDDGSYSSHLAFSTKKPGAGTNPLVEAMRITATGNVGIGAAAPEGKLEVNGTAVISDGNGWAVRNRFMAPGSLTVGGVGSNYGGGQQWTSNTAGLLLETLNNTEIAVHDAGRRVASLMYYEGDTVNRLTIGRNMGWDAISQVVVAGHLEVAGVLKARSIQSSNPLQHRMYPADPLVYQDIFAARDAGAIKKLGGGGYDDKTYVVTLWNDRRIIMFGNNDHPDGNGAEVVIPAGYDTVWIRVLGERWTVFHAYFLDGGGDLGVWAGGYRSVNNYCPDGSLSDGWQAVHQWVPIPARRAGRLALVPKANTGGDFWLSGLAFSRNPWAHAAQPAISYHWKTNGSVGIEWADNGHNWNNDQIARVMPKATNQVIVPVVPSGRDKLLYLIEHNSNWNGASHSGITVNGKPIERFIASYDNPFARHWNSKFYQRYLAARIPADLIGDVRYLTVQVDMSKQADPIYFREIGTHDLDVPPPA